MIQAAQGQQRQWQPRQQGQQQRQPAEYKLEIETPRDDDIRHLKGNKFIIVKLAARLIKGSKAMEGHQIQFYANRAGLEETVETDPNGWATLTNAIWEAMDKSTFTVDFDAENVGFATRAKKVTKKLPWPDETRTKKTPEQEKIEELKAKAGLLGAETVKIGAETEKLKAEKAKVEATKAGEKPPLSRDEELKLEAKVIEAETSKITAETTKLKVEKEKAEAEKKEPEEKHEPSELIVDPTRVGNKINFFIRVVDQKDKGIGKLKITIVDGPNVLTKRLDEDGERMYAIELQLDEEREIAIYVAGYGDKGFRRTFRGRRQQ